MSDWYDWMLWCRIDYIGIYDSVPILLFPIIFRKYNIFNHLKSSRKLGDLRNPYYVYYFLEIATIFGKEEVIRQAEKLGYHMQLPVGIKKIDLREMSQL